MQNIIVDKAKLLETLKDNRDKHRDIFLKAQDVYRETVIDLLDQRLHQARSGGKIELYISLPQPQDYTAEFDTAISMVEWDQGDTVTLSEKDFNRYVLNKWEWAAAFAANTQSYVAQ